MDLGLLSEVASSLDPQQAAHPQGRFFNNNNNNSTASTSQAQLGDIPVDESSPHDISVHGYAEENRGSRREGRIEETLDPSLRPLTNSSPNRRTYDITNPLRFDLESDESGEEEDDGSSDEDDREDSEDDDGTSAHRLEPAPQSVEEQLRQLRDLDDQASTSLAANRQYQKELNELKERFETAKQRTRELKAFVRTISAELLAGAEMRIVAPGTIEPGLPWFKYNHGKNLPPNPDGEARERYLSATRWIPWTPPEKQKLKDEIMAFNNRQIVANAMARDLDVSVELASKPKKWFVENVEGLNWDEIARIIPRRSALDCKLQWLQHDHPSLNFSKLSKDEMERLCNCVEEKGIRDWNEIASEVGNNRVAWDLLKKYRNRAGQRTEWTKESDATLREAVKIYGENWQLVARHCGRHSNACINRWTKSLRPSIVRGKWSKEEDEVLRTAIGTVGKNWRLVAPRVKGRTDAQCRERWLNFLDPKLKKKQPWTPEEDRMLLEAKEAGKSWIEISRVCFDETRTDNNCLRRHAELVKPAKKKSKKGKKKRERKCSDDELEDDGFGSPRPLAEGEQEDGEGEGEGEGEGGETATPPPPSKKRPKRAATKNPRVDLAVQLQAEIDSVTGERAGGRVNEEEEDIPVAGASNQSRYDILNFDDDSGVGSSMTGGGGGAADVDMNGQGAGEVEGGKGKGKATKKATTTRAKRGPAKGRATRSKQ